jgi:hypothetical protein
MTLSTGVWVLVCGPLLAFAAGVAWSSTRSSILSLAREVLPSPDGRAIWLLSAVNRGLGDSLPRAYVCQVLDGQGNCLGIVLPHELRWASSGRPTLSPGIPGVIIVLQVESTGPNNHVLTFPGIAEESRALHIGSQGVPTGQGIYEPGPRLG